MGLFSKKKRNQEVEEIDIQQEKPNVPITLGNCYDLNERLKIQEQIDKSQLDYEEAQKPQISTKQLGNVFSQLSKLKMLGRDRKYEFWYILNFHANYYQNILQFEMDDIEMFKKVLMCFRYSWIYGDCGIYKIGDNYIPVYEIKAETDALGELKQIHLGLMNLVINSKEMVDIQKQAVWKVIDAKDANYIRLISNIWGLGAVVTWLPFIKQQTDNLKRIFSLSYILHKKILYKITDMSFSTKELDLYLDVDIPLAFKLDAYTGNDFSVEEFVGLSEGLDASIKYYEFFLKSYYELLGRRLNSDYKMERNVAAEVDASQSNYDVLEFDMKQFRRSFLNKLSKISGVQWKEIGGIENDVERMNNNKSNEHPMKSNKDKMD